MNKRIRHLAAVGACVALCVVYILLAGSAVSQKSATYDEPMHVVAGWRMLWRDEYGFNADQPPLWQYWIALPLPKDALNYDATPTSLSPDLRAIDALYRIPPAAGIELVKRARGMCLPLAVALGVLIAVWAGRLAGGVAAVAALFAFALDPNWLAHGPLAKNDVALSLAFVATAYATWRLGQRACPATVAAVLLLPAICLAIKLSGVLATPIVAICLLARTVMPTAWIAGGRRRAVLLAAAICLGIAVVDYAAIWAEYRFQWRSDVDVPAAVRNLQLQQVRIATGDAAPTPEELAAWRPGGLVRCVLWMENRRLLPQAWVDLFLYFRANDSGTYQAFLLGDMYVGRRWDYFPLVWLFKEPVSLILAASISASAAVRAARRLTWTSVVLLVAALLYAAVIMSGNLNVGIRYLLPILALMDIGIGVAAATAWRSGWLVARFLVLLLAA
ncbi:MAG TPA: hypothetical protein VL992_20795, partial [Tepidisphaeraceae bacterium]|nr:hypothetical protein [Tepidisphaeraceae bacterium]